MKFLDIVRTSPQDKKLQVVNYLIANAIDRVVNSFCVNRSFSDRFHSNYNSLRDLLYSILFFLFVQSSKLCVQLNTTS